MRRHQPLPRLWLMTDERQGDGLWDALDRLPAGAGIVFRHYSLPVKDRRRLFELVRAIARRRRLVLLLAGSPRLAAAWGADGSHGRYPEATSRPVHRRSEIRAAGRAGAQLIFVSPAFPTRSHPGKRSLGPVRFALMVRNALTPVIALGGMDALRWRRVARSAHGWAAIDAWSR